MHKFFFYLRSTSVIYPKFYKNLASIDADYGTFCAYLLTSQVVMVQRLQRKSFFLTNISLGRLKEKRLNEKLLNESFLLHIQIIIDSN